MGTPQAIPGRVELANLDEGGLNVAFFADHRRENAVAEGYAPISGDDWRPGNLALPNICKTNRAKEVPGEGSEDFWEDGTRYPSDAMPFVYYMGYAHTVDWVRVTVSVKQPGKYNVSSSWACANNPCGLSIWFNDGSGKSDDANHPLDGVNKTGEVKFEATNDYHKWRKYPNFTQVDLTAGDQLMTFHVAVNNHLQYGYLVFDPVDGVIQGGAGGTGSGGGTGMAGAASAGTAGVDGSGGAAGAADTTPVGPVGTSGTATSTSGGTAPSTPGASGTATGGTGVTGLSDTSTSSGCALSPASSGTRTPRSSGFASLLLLGYLLRRRRRA
jgi:MYXO-CTERM domain-containing protein